MHPQFLALGAAILLLSPVHAVGPNLNIRSKMDLAGGPRFGLPASNEKVAVSHSQFAQRDFLGFLSEGASAMQRKTSSGGGSYTAGNVPQSPSPNGGYPPMRQEGGEGNDPEDGQDRDMFDEGDDQPDRHHGGQAKRSLVGLLTQPASKSPGTADEEDTEDNGPEAKRSFKARRRELVRRDFARRSVKGDVFKAEMNLDSTLDDAEKLVNNAVSHTQSSVNGVGSTVSEYVKSKNPATGASGSAPATSKGDSTSTSTTTQGQEQTMGNTGSDKPGQLEQGGAGAADQNSADNGDSVANGSDPSTTSSSSGAGDGTAADSGDDTATDSGDDTATDSGDEPAAGSGADAGTGGDSASSGYNGEYFG